MNRTLVPSMYWKKKPSCAAAIVAANTGGSRGGDRAVDHGRTRPRNGPERMSSAPISNKRCVGESRASMDTSIPKTMCQSMSPMRAAMNTTTPATEVP